RKKLRESDMPWYGKETTFEGKRLPESCVKSSEMLRTYGRDLNQVKRWISTAISAPPGFPSSEWDNLVRGRAANLDVIFSSLYQVLPVTEKRGKIGEKEISLGYTEPAKKVETYGDWVIAWHALVKAMDFLFPHRHEELLQYGDFIQGEFSSRRPEAHGRVLCFDQAVRQTVGGGTSTLLTNYKDFAKHRTAILHSEGLFVDIEESRAKGKRPQQTGPDSCNRFNSELGCPNGASSCRYKHVCRRCGSGRHGITSCEIKR
ncbi:hypothetical protein FA13DRAFT_1629697, partial [Coprinellus micaceus]